MPTLLQQLQQNLGGHYVLLREVGRGGMATVFLARDEKHQRDVALKVLDPELAAVLGADRFLSEIRVTAAMQHPNILPLFDSGEAGGLLYYVMPFVDGESLRHRLNREKQLPVDETLRLTTAIANALEYAHKRGIIHRDLKPENILLQSGQPVVADFGIALAVSNAGGARVTQTGLSLGTPQYMSPEQATGDRVIDARSDIYSLGAMTYEMLTGEPPHTGTSAQAIIAKLITSEPQPVRVLRPTVPPNVAMAVEHALAKLAADRFGSAREFADALSNPGYFTSAATAAIPKQKSESRRTIAVLSLLSVVMAVAALWGWLRPQPPQRLVRYAVAFDSAQQLEQGARWGRIALSPDGSMMAYIGGPENMILVRRRDELEARPLPGTARGAAPAFSPDGKRVAFIHNAQTLMIASLDGTPTFAVTDSLIGFAGLAWGTDDMLYVDGRGASPLVRVAPRAGAKPEFAFALDSASGEVDQTFPQALPDGKGVLYTSSHLTRDLLSRTNAIAILDVATRKRHVIAEDATRGRYVETGHVAYTTREGNLMAVPLSLSGRKTTGAPVLIAQGLSRESSRIDFDFSRDGTLAYVSATSSTGGRELTWVSREGRESSVDSAWRGDFGDPALSPDEKLLAISTASSVTSPPTGDIWIRELATGEVRRLSVDGGVNRLPIWSSDSKWIVYLSNIDNRYLIVRKPADGSAAASTLVASSEPVTQLAMTPDDSALLFTIGSATSAHVYRRALNDTVNALLFPHDPTAMWPAVSPDGRWIAYVSHTSRGEPQVFVSPYPDITKAKWVISPGNGSAPFWSADGKEILYRESATRNLLSVPVTTNGTFSYRAPRVLFSLAPYTSRLVSKKDGGFLMVKRAGGGSMERLIIVENWMQALGAAVR